MATINENVPICGSCIEEIKDACSLECGHTICIDCLVLFTRRRPSAIKAKSVVCPTCRGMTKVPHPDQQIEDWPKQLKPDSEAQDSLDVIYERPSAIKAKSVVCPTCRGMTKVPHPDQPIEDWPKQLKPDSEAQDSLDVIYERPSAIKVKSVVCPTCRGMTKVPHPDQPIEDWPKQLKPDSEAQDSLDDIYETVDAPGTSYAINENQELVPSIKCEKHNSDIEFCCQDCNKAICAKCSMLYHKECETVVPLESMTNVLRTTKAISTLKGLSNSEDDDQEHPLNMCKTHNAGIEFYCQDCSEALCVECLSSGHEYCDNVVSLESMVPEMRTKGINAIACIKSTSQDLKCYHHLVKSDINRANEMKAFLEMKIGNISKHAIQIIQRKEKMLQDELEKTTKRTVELLKEEVVITESKMQMYESELEHMTKAFESGSELDLYQLYQRSKGLKCDVDIVSPALSMHLVNELKISEFKDSFELCTLKEVQDELGEPVLVQTIDTRSKDDLYQDIFDVVVLSFDEKEAIVITDCYMNSVTVISNRDGVQQMWKLRFQVKPLSLSKLNEKQVVVCFQTKKEFALVNVFPELNIQSKHTTLKLYRCLTVLGPNRLAGACEDPPSVDIIDLSGTVLQNVCTAKTGLSTIMREPWFISSTSNGNIVLTDANSQFGVTALDRDGKVVFKKKIGQKDGTSGITPGQHQGVVVADLFNYRVLELTETGEINRELLTRSHGLHDLETPYGVCMHRGKLYVAAGENGVKVFRFKAERANKVEEEKIDDEFSIEDDHVYSEIDECMI